MVICLEQGADLHTDHLIPLPLTVSCFSKIQIGFTFVVPAHPGSPRQTGVCVCVTYSQLSSVVRCQWMEGYPGYKSLLNFPPQSPISEILAEVVE